VHLFGGLELSPLSFAAVAAASSVVSGVSALLLARPAERIGLLSRSRRDRFGEGRVPLTGGPGLLLGGVAALAALRAPVPPGVLVAGGSFFLAGLLDDIFSLRPLPKAALQGAAALVSVLAIAPSPPLAGVGVLLFLLLVNASNYTDNMDGLLGGVALAQAAALAFLSTHAGAGAAVLLWALPGAALLTFPPARVYLGDSGSHLVGALFGADSLRLLADGRGFHARFLLPLAVLFLVPLGDMATVTVSRLLRKRPIFRGGTDHWSHRLVRRGFPVARAVAILVLASAVCGVASLLLLRAS
jgi:UDP-GlcNAc:undecaprenyl-phosphate GlcNAc-1-phosphate transferase